VNPKIARPLPRRRSFDLPVSYSCLLHLRYDNVRVRFSRPYLHLRRGLDGTRDGFDPPRSCSLWFESGTRLMDAAIVYLVPSRARLLPVSPLSYPPPRLSLPLHLAVPRPSPHGPPRRGQRPRSLVPAPSADLSALRRLARTSPCPLRLVRHSTSSPPPIGMNGWAHEFARVRRIYAKLKIPPSKTENRVFRWTATPLTVRGRIAFCIATSSSGQNLDRFWVDTSEASHSLPVSLLRR
jgi:hypothetical protein